MYTLLFFSIYDKIKVVPYENNTYDKLMDSVDKICIVCNKSFDSTACLIAHRRKNHHLDPKNIIMDHEMVYGNDQTCINEVTVNGYTMKYFKDLVLDKKMYNFLEEFNTDQLVEKLNSVSTQLESFNEFLEGKGEIKSEIIKPLEFQDKIKLFPPMELTFRNTCNDSIIEPQKFDLYKARPTPSPYSIGDIPKLQPIQSSRRDKFTFEPLGNAPDIQGYESNTYSSLGSGVFNGSQIGGGSNYMEINNLEMQQPMNVSTLFKHIYYNKYFQTYSIIKYKISYTYFPELEYIDKLPDYRIKTFNQLIEECVNLTMDDVKHAVALVKKYNHKDIQENVKKIIQQNYILHGSDDSHRIKSSFLLNQIINFCNANEDQEKFIRRNLQTILSELGLQKKRYSDGQYWFGIEHVVGKKATSIEDYLIFRENDPNVTIEKPTSVPSELKGACLPEDIDMRKEVIKHFMSSLNK